MAGVPLPRVAPALGSASPFGAELDASLREADIAARLQERQGRQLAARFGGGFGLRRAARPTAADLRAAASFGLVGGELCGCHQWNCQPCAANRGCGDQSCRPCTLLGYTAAAHLGPITRASSPGPGAWMKGRQPGSFGAGLPGAPDTSGVDLDEGTVPPVGIIDVHAHNFCVDYSQYLGTEFTERVEHLVDWRDVERMVLMGSKDSADFFDDPVRDTMTINVPTAAAWGRYPDYFLPFYHILTADLDDAALQADVTRYLEAGFVGIGELFVHGHHENFPTNTPTFVQWFVTAANYGVPVSVHWDMGGTDTETSPAVTYTPEQNWKQFEELLIELRDAQGLGEDFTIILCHCGAGPNSALMEPDDAGAFTVFEEYKARIDTLLADYPMVLFDLAGMQHGTEGVKVVFELYTPGLNEPTPLGDFLLSRIAMYPGRFLIGTDADNGVATDTTYLDSSGNTQVRLGAENYRSSLENYRLFLTLPSAEGGLLDVGVQAQVLVNNARGVFSAFL